MLKNNRSFTYVISTFENEIMKKSKGEYASEIANACEHIVYETDVDDSFAYALQYNIEEKTFSIVKELFEPNNGDWLNTEYLETYPIELYNREFLVSRIVTYISQFITESINR